jgi:hypothetical protein
MCAPVAVSFIGSLVNLTTAPARMQTRWPQHRQLHDIVNLTHTHHFWTSALLAFRCESSWPSAVWQSSTHRTDLFPRFPLSSRRGWRATSSTRTVSRAPPLRRATCCSNTHDMARGCMHTSDYAYESIMNVLMSRCLLATTPILPLHSATRICSSDAAYMATLSQ